MLMWWTMFTFLISVDWIIKLMDFIRTRDPGPCAAAAGHKRQQIYFIYWLIETKINTGSRFPPEQSVKVWRRASEHQIELQILSPGRGWVGTFPRRWRNNGGTFDTTGQLSPLWLEVKRPSNPWKCTFICTQFRYSLLHHLRICRFVTGSCEIGQASSPEVFICRV